MALSQHKRAFGVFLNYHQVTGALQELKGIGFPINQVSVINKQQEQEQIHDRKELVNKAQEITNVGAIAGGVVGGTTGLVVGMGTAAALIPGIGPVALLGAAAVTLATTLTSSVIGATAGSLVGALISYGIPQEQATVYSDRISSGEYFVMVDGTEQEVRQAVGVLNRWNIQELRILDREGVRGS
ncbi:MAG TPA: DUF1269 domain-containing protein [Cyanobacteria bacterium UBA8803]|nr:DUF1269 domain-containing protein [Cyanobacteria bacterium UBA9273]HBL59975.1 DUF1269 domain-containing protein [Cyanobacteria bacterium UBA8803]